VAKDIDHDVFDNILFRMMNGEAITAICKEEDQPHYPVFMKWVQSDQDLFDSYARARAIQADYFFDQMVEIADHDPDINRAKMRVDARKWHTSKISPRKYGDRLMAQLDATVTHQVKPDLSGLSFEAREELRNLLIQQMRQTPKTIEGRVEVDE
jgi:hypothetical protein